MKKRTIIGLLCLVIVISFFTIFNKNNPSENPDNLSSFPDGKKLKFWSIANQNDAFSNSYKKAIADFENAHKGIKIEHNTFDNYSYKTKIKSAANSDSLPDIFYTWGGQFSQPFVDNQKVLPLDNYYTDYQEQLPEIALTYTTYDGKIYGSTYTTTISVLYYNKRLLAANGTQAPTTFDDLVSTCKTLKDKGITPIGISAKNAWVLAIIHDYLAMRSAGAGKTQSVLQKKGFSYDDPDFLAASLKFKELIDIGAFPEDSTRMVNDVVKQQFLTGNIAMYTMGTWLTDSIQELPDAADFDAIPFPIVNDNATATDFMGGAIDTLMVNKSTAEPDIAGKAVFELTKQISKYCYLEGAGLPAWKKDYDDSSVNEMTKKLAGFVESATSFTMWFDTLMATEDTTEYLRLLESLYVGTTTPENFIKDMAKQLDKK